MLSEYQCFNIQIRLWHTGGGLSHNPSFWHVSTETPTNSKPLSQTYIAISPTEVPESDTFPLLGDVRRGQRAE